MRGAFRKLAVFIGQLLSKRCYSHCRGDFNASIGMVRTMICLDPGVLVKGLNAEDGLYNGFCRMDCVWGREEVYDTTEGWTCRRSSDGMFVQIDFI